MTDRPTRQDIQQLSEPTRSKALDILQHLQNEGYTESEAVELAFRQAEEWEASRQPGITPPVESRHLADVRTGGLQPEDVQD